MTDDMPIWTEAQLAEMRERIEPDSLVDEDYRVYISARDIERIAQRVVALLDEREAMK